MISFSDVFLRYTEGKKVLIIVPVNTLQNWLHEFNMWLPTKEKADQQQGTHISFLRLCLYVSVSRLPNMYVFGVQCTFLKAYLGLGFRTIISIPG